MLLTRKQGAQQKLVVVVSNTVNTNGAMRQRQIEFISCCNALKEYIPQREGIEEVVSVWYLRGVVVKQYGS